MIGEIKQALAILSQKVNELSNALKAKPDVYFGTVDSVSGDTANVVLDGNTEAVATSMQCLCVAGDRVTVVRRGTSLATVAVKGGEDLLLDNSYEIRRSYVDSTASNNSVSNNSYVYYKFGDKNGLFTGWVGNIAQTSGIIQTQLAARKKVNGSNVDNVLYLSVDNDGNKLIRMTDPGAWLDGLAQQSPTTTTTIADVITANTTNATISSVGYAQWGKIAMLTVYWSNVNAISVPVSGNITNLTIGTVVSGKRPVIRVHPQCDGDNSAIAFYSLSNDGTLQVGGFDSHGSAYTIAASSTHRLSVTYLLA